jgi:anti-anti-sigma regulatory factor
MVHLHLQGALAADTCTVLERTAASCIEGGQLLVVHLKDLEHASPEGLGALLVARQQLLAQGLSLSLAGVPARMKILFSAWCLEPLFDEFNIDTDRFILSSKPKQAAAFAGLVGTEAVASGKSEG